MRTPEQITEKVTGKNLTPLGERRMINRLYRNQDESHLWPVNGKFDATERAIGRVQRLERAYGTLSNLEYCYMLETELSNIVNGRIK